MKKLNCIEIAAVLIGGIMGAGFASGRECWQFFGVFGNTGYYGTILFTAAFLILALMISYISINLNSCELGTIVSPFESILIKQAIAYVLAFIYYTLIIAMSAAGGSLLTQQFGINKYIGGLLVVFLVIVTVCGNFERLSGIFKYMVPVLFIFSIITVCLVINEDFNQSGVTTGFKPSELAPNWIFSAVIFLAYNSLGMITMIGSSAINAKSRKSAYTGSVIAALMLGLLTILLLKALLTDMAFSDSLDLPMLGYSARISKILNIVFALVLFGAVYSTASSTYYGFSTKIPEGKAKNIILIIMAVIGYFLGLSGFKKMVEYLYPIQGYIGIVIIILITINFVKIYVNKHINK